MRQFCELGDQSPRMQEGSGEGRQALALLPVVRMSTSQGHPMFHVQQNGCSQSRNKKYVFLFCLRYLSVIHQIKQAGNKRVIWRNKPHTLRNGEDIEGGFQSFADEIVGIPGEWLHRACSPSATGEAVLWELWGQWNQKRIKDPQRSRTDARLVLLRSQTGRKKSWHSKETDHSG